MIADIVSEYCYETATYPVIVIVQEIEAIIKVKSEWKSVSDPHKFR